MSLGRFRRLTRRELEPFSGRAWVASGAEQDADSFRLDGVAVHLDGHPEAVTFVWSFAVARGDEWGTPVWVHVPYPQSMTGQARRALTELQAYRGGFGGFLGMLRARAALLD